MFSSPRRLVRLVVARPAVPRPTARPGGLLGSVKPRLYSTLHELLCADVHFDEDFVWRTEVFEMLFGDDDRFWDYADALPCEIEPDEQFPPSDYAPNGDSILEDLDEGEFELDINGIRST